MSIFESILSNIDKLEPYGIYNKFLIVIKNNDITLYSEETNDLIEKLLILCEKTPNKCCYVFYNTFSLSIVSCSFEIINLVTQKIPIKSDLFTRLLKINSKYNQFSSYYKLVHNMECYKLLT